MKKISKLLAAVALVLVATFTVSANPFQICNGNVDFKIVNLTPTVDGSNLVVSYEVKVGPEAIDDCSSLLLTPVIKSGVHKHLVEVLVINGSTLKGIESKWLANELYSVCDANNVRVFNQKEGETVTIKTTKTFPYEDWMDGAAFTVTSQQATYKPNCIKAYPGEEEICSVPYYGNPFEIQPEFVPVSIDEAGDLHKISTRLYYPVNGTQRVDSYLENKEALHILNTLDADNANIVRIEIDGWASPEATVAYNQGLSERRAATLKGIIEKKYKFEESIFATAGNGEYWKLVEEFIDSSDDASIASNRSALKDALSIADLDAREAEMKKIDGGKPYKVIFNNTYPRSRFADCDIYYSLKEFSVADLEALYNADPKNLNSAEYAYLLTNGAGDDVLKAGIALYPDSQALNAFAAERALADFNVAAAIEHYKKAGDSEAVMNNLGACYLLIGDADAAEACFQRAGELEQLDKNLQELNELRINRKYFK